MLDRRRVVALAATALVLPGAASRAQGRVDTAASEYLGPIRVEVDTTDTAHRVFRINQSIPVRPGRLTLFFPRFPPGTHGPYGAVQRVAGLAVRHDRGTVPWSRDPVDPFAFHVDVPEGTTSIDLSFHYLARSGNNSEEGSSTRDFVGLSWSQALMYPAGHHPTNVRMQPSIVLPPGWKYATSLRTDSRRGDVVRFEPVSLEELVDSPVFAGPHMARHELDVPGAPRPAALNIFAAKASELQADAKQIDAHRKLVQQADLLFGARHWNRYEFLLALNDEIGFDGLEHHQSSENIVRTDYFKDWDKSLGARALLPHEFAHSWNGKFRRPADMLTPDFNQPGRNNLLWVYEGQTEFLGVVLAARSGLWTNEQARHELAQTQAWFTVAPGRRWRSLEDTTHQGAMRGRTLDISWRSWTRGEDYYDEGMLIWLDADMLIRERTGGAKSLDDFARTFFGVHDGRIDPLPYTFDDVVAALNAVHPHDWRAFLRERLDAVGRAAPDAWLARAGWKLSWSDQASDLDKAFAARRKVDSFGYSLGFTVGQGGKLVDVVWDSPAFKADLAPGAELLAINDLAYNAERLDDAMKANRDGREPLRLLVKEGERFRTATIDYRDGPRHPKLERVDGSVERLDAGLLAPR
jgi:predicted metalloprotease with PDZ domain